MPCLHSDALESVEPAEPVEPGRAAPRSPRAAGTREPFRADAPSEPAVARGTRWFCPPTWRLRTETRNTLDEGFRNNKVQTWLDDNGDFGTTFSLRRASACLDARTHTSPLPRIPRSRSDHSDLSMKRHRRVTESHSTVSSSPGRLKPLSSSLSARDCLDRYSPDVLSGRSPCSPRSSRASRFSFSPRRPLSPRCTHSPDSPELLCATAAKTAVPGGCEGCPWATGLLGGGLSRVGSVAELCEGAAAHAGALLEAECCSLCLVEKDGGGRRSLEEVVGPTAPGPWSSRAHQELVKSIMGCVLATESTMNLSDLSEDQRFNVDQEQTSDFKRRGVLSLPIKSTRGKVLGVVVMIKGRSPEDSPLSVFTTMHEKVLSGHMDALGMFLDHLRLYESARQEAGRSQALLEMAQVLSKEHHSFEVLLTKMAATILPSTRAQYCTIFIPSERTSTEKISFSNVIHLECEEFGSSCQIYRREHDISDIDPSHALRTAATGRTLNAPGSGEGSTRSLICCPVRNGRSDDVIAVCQLMNKRSGEAFDGYDRRLLEDLAVYCGLALQYVQAVRITEQRRASIEVTQEVLAYHITAAEREIQALQEAPVPSAEALHILHFHFSGFGLPEELSTQATVRMFLDLGLVREFNIDYRTLCQWVLTVRRGYRNNVPYHNWSHALSTAQSMFAMLMATDELQAVFSRLEILALMIATLNHDLDHRGVNNSYIERTQQPLAQLYGHSSLENHHYSLCLFILNNTGSQILSGLSAEAHRAVLLMIKRAILSTDLTVYMERRKEFFSLTKKSRTNWRSEKQRDLLRSMLMTASDLSAVTKPWPEQKRIANLVAMEFFAQGDKEKEELNVKPIDIMNRENSKRLPYMQVEYIDDICCPLYKALSRLFDACSPLLNGCKTNREKWLQLAEKEQKENSESSVTLERNLQADERTDQLLT
ncbi:cGMP-specific 3',5'-cyclic phosphodiesterase-like [Betta splendens]|uniref:Phosphodiesterase n=1 Tax=Betta splendens TaxID=158456 RepID=A0A6P7NRH0_BETSP|nr:cGMP-specific 3',5'-cyclic phosphodiesterase-like [Betta splendens]